MKRQGIEGFTFNSKAEEWAAWAVSVLEHDTPRSGRQLLKLTGMIADYQFDANMEYLRTKNPDPYRAIIWRDEPRKAPLWPFAAIGFAAVAAVIIWTWG